MIKNSLTYKKKQLLKCIAKSRLFLSCFLLGLLITSQSINAAIYVYIAPDGSNIISDQKIKKPGYKLKRSYKTKPYRSRSSSRKNPHFAKTIKSQYDALIVNLALQYGMEPSFIKSIIHVESAFDNQAVSHAGAMGLMQLLSLIHI